MINKRFNKLLKKIETDEKAFDELYDFYYKRIIFHLKGRFGEELSEDVAQEFFIKTYSREYKNGFYNKSYGLGLRLLRKYCQKPYIKIGKFNNFRTGNTKAGDCSFRSRNDMVVRRY